MFISIRCLPIDIDPKIAEIKAKQYARRYVIMHRETVAEKLLNDYFEKTYKIPLKTVCLSLIKHCRITKASNEYTVRFKTLDQDKLAAFITYGNGVLIGCPVLTNAFK